MTQQPTALRLADMLERMVMGYPTIEAAAELRRLHAEVDSLSYRLAYPDNFVSPEVEELRAINAQLLEALEDLMDTTEEPPDRNCSCHVSPPCGDCVDYSGVREALEKARAAIKAAKEQA